MKRLAFVLALLSIASACAVYGEDLEIFRLSRGGTDNWIWGEARIKSKLGKFLLQEYNKKGTYGDVYTADRFPYVKNGIIKLNVDQVISGSYTLQLLAFQGDKHIETIDLVKGATQTGHNAFSLNTIDMKPGVDSILFKFWVGDMEGAATKLIDLAYVLPVADDALVFDERFEDVSVWQGEQAIMARVRDETAVTLGPGETFGAIIHPEKIGISQASLLFLDIADVQNGDMTVQLVAFDDIGTYLKSIDVIKSVRAGTHVVRLHQVNWPSHADSFMIKIWLGGQISAKAIMNRVAIVK